VPAQALDLADLLRHSDAIPSASGATPSAQRFDTCRPLAAVTRAASPDGESCAGRPIPQATSIRPFVIGC